MARVVRSPAGEVWHVRRVILPDALRPLEPFDAFAQRWHVVRGTEGQLTTVGVQYGVPPGSVQVFGQEGLASLMLWVALLLLAPLLLPIAFVARVVLHRPWWVEATSHGQVLRWRVHGFRIAGRVRDEVAAALASGAREPAPAGAERVVFWGSPVALERAEQEHRVGGGGA